MTPADVRLVRAIARLEAVRALAAYGNGATDMSGYEREVDEARAVLGVAGFSGVAAWGLADPGEPGGGVVVPEALAQPAWQVCPSCPSPASCAGKGDCAMDAPSAPRRGPGRPRETGRASAGARKITVRVSEYEDVILRERAAALGVTEAEVLRRGALG